MGRAVCTPLGLAQGSTTRLTCFENRQKIEKKLFPRHACPTLYLPLGVPSIVSRDVEKRAPWDLKTRILEGVSKFSNLSYERDLPNGFDPINFYKNYQKIFQALINPDL